MERKIRKIVIILMSLLFSICFFIGKAFDENYNVLNHKVGIIKMTVLFIVTGIVIFILYIGFDRYFQKTKKESSLGRIIFDEKNGKIAWIIMMMAWMPNYISYLPGIFTVDAINQLEQFINHVFTDHHPILTTLIISPIILFGKQVGHLGIGLAIYLLLTFCFTSFILSKGFLWMSKHKTPYLLRMIMLVYFCIYPIWSAYARTLVKDTLFYPIFYLYILFLFEIMTAQEDFFEEKVQFVQFIVLSILLCLIRHNGFYVAVVSTVGLIYFCKKNRKKCTALLVGIIVFWQVFNGCLPKMGITPGGKQEMLSIPFQQTARYVKEHGDEVTQEEKNVINKVLDYSTIGKNYDPNLSDPVKNTYKRNDQYISDYFKVWWKQFLKHPQTYINATLNGTYGYYAYKERIKNPCGYYGQPVYYWKYEKRYKVHFKSPLSIGRKVYEKSVEKFFVNGPLKILTQPMLYHWAMILLLGYFLQNKKLRKYWVVFLPIIISFLICIASPVNGDLRYTLPVMATSIMYFAFTIDRVKNEGSTQEE